MNLLRLFWKLLRYRVAVMLVLFMLLAVAIHGGLAHPTWRLAAAILALAFSYISATSSNDLADEDIDMLNHPASPGRPLVNGQASHRDMWAVFTVASTLCVVCAGAVSLRAVGIMAVSVLLNVLYSLPPVRLSYRTYLAPLVLGLAYVCVPYLLGLSLLHVMVAATDIGWLAGLYLLFVGRIILKDFRDRAGDAQYHKPTFLLRHGKAATCLVSFTGLSLGCLIMAIRTWQEPWLTSLVAAYFASIAYMLYRLLRAAVGADEQLAIGIGAKMGNGLLITLLCAYILRGAQVDQSQQIISTGALSLIFFANYAAFLRHPDGASNGYRG